MNQVNVGIIGCGSIVMQRHAPEYAANPASQIIGFYDQIQERARAAQKRFGGEIYDSVEALLSDRRIDAVSVCTANATHASLSIAALQAGKHVLCEKPMATTLADCLEMGEIAEKSGKILMIGHNQRFAAAHVTAKKLLKSENFGHVITFRTTFGHKGPEYWSADKSRRTWFFDSQSASFGAAADLGIHKLDLIMWLLEDQIDKVSAYCETLDKKDMYNQPITVDDNMLCLLKMRKGSMGTLSASWTYYGDEDNSTILYCEKGIIRIYDNTDYPVEIQTLNGDKALYKVGSIQTNDDVVQSNSGVIDAFVESVIHKSPPSVSYQEAISAMKAIFTCIESSKAGKVLKIE